MIRMPAPATLIVATWNIHGGIGIDGRYSSARIVEVLNELDADIVALQEVASPEAHENFLHEIERETGYHVAAGLLRRIVTRGQHGRVEDVPSALDHKDQMSVKREDHVARQCGCATDL